MSILDTNLDTTPVSRRKMSNGKYQYSIRIPGRTSSKYALLAPSLDAFPAPPTAAMQRGRVPCVFRRGRRQSTRYLPRARPTRNSLSLNVR